MFNHNRGLWGYTGSGRRRRAADDPEHRDGRPERRDRARGAVRSRPRRRAIRVGTCGALDAELALGDLVIASRPRRRTERAARSARTRVGADPGLVATLQAAAAGAGARAGAVASRDLFDEREPQRPRAGRRRARSRSRWRPRRCCASASCAHPRRPACSRSATSSTPRASAGGSTPRRSCRPARGSAARPRGARRGGSGAGP